MSDEFDNDGTLRMRCPKCGQEDRFKISCFTWATIGPEGAEEYEDAEYDETRAAQCTSTISCGWTGKVADLQEAYKKANPEEENNE